MNAPAALPSSQWSQAPLSEPRVHFTLATVGSKVLFAGGTTDGTPNAATAPGTVDIYDGATGEWSTAALSQVRLAPTAVAVGTTALFAGGDSAVSRGTSTVSAVVDIYDDATGQWSSASLSPGRRAMRTAVARNKVLFAGGSTATWGPPGSGPGTGTVDAYDSATGSWSTTSLPQGEIVAVVGIAGPRVVFVGSRAVHVYDTAAAPVSGQLAP
jgi:hypothetical protein